MRPVVFHLEATDRAARAGTIGTPHGTIDTPAFVPVGTKGAVRALDGRDLAEVGTQIVLANTYHLMLRPGAEAVAARGGLHRFMAWDRPILTDSGGYQIFSLDPRVDESGAGFKSTYDGSAAHLTPEDAVRTQELLGPDIAMALDVCIGLPALKEAVVEAMERTLRWAERCRTVHRRQDQGLFGIVQGGSDADLRTESAERTAALDFDGYGIGGLSVGETPEDRRVALEAATRSLPVDKPRYVMGLGDTEGVLDAIERGADLFDCVWPTRLARHGRVLSAEGDFNLRRAEFATDDRPLSSSCGCSVCSTHTRAYLRHLLSVGEITALRLLSIHNLAYTLDLMAAARRAIGRQNWGTFRRSLVERRAAAEMRR